MAAACHAGGMSPEPATWWPISPAPRLSLAQRAALGALVEYVDDPRVTDVFVLAGGEVYVDTGQGAQPVRGARLGTREVDDLARGLIEFGGRHVDEIQPLADVNLGAGLRVHVALPPVSHRGAVVSIRVGQPSAPGLDALALADAPRVIPALMRAVANKATMLVSGATGSGKTTLVAALMAYVPITERIVVLEDLAELRIDHPHVVSLETRQASAEGTGEITLARLVRESLRMRPNRLVVGECRGVEIQDMLQAFLTGHRGGATTIHAPDLAEVPARLDALGASAGLSPGQLARQARSAFDLVLHVSRLESSIREVRCGRLVVDERGDLAVEEVDIEGL